MCVCVRVLSPPASALSFFLFSWAPSDMLGCTGYQFRAHLAFQELAELLQQLGAQGMVAYFMFSFLSEVAELSQAAGKRLSKAPLSPCRRLSVLACPPALFTDCDLVMEQPVSFKISLCQPLA